ncbi:hypothetical protein C2E25_08250 [Geothermobacter hydrogeniphilus]|uniref:Uncharacterized protein n=1 Tax=Geothermobacter hydrogeniphilus TaxID=1969733 RepID=A0A2K2HAJ0_9BACT|nr:hypothetical protein [Geothermobacter hydrogeniphilus]PNU20287.1 hypothetical protein C2E25_08250 [Geothermobacter hydrogeniphilus]
MKQSKRNKVFSLILATLLFSICWAGTALGLTLNLVAEQATVTMADGNTITMWGLRDTADATHVAGDWKIPVFNITLPDTLTINLTNNLPADTASLVKPTSLMIPGLREDAMSPVWTDGSSGARTSVSQRVRSLNREAGNGGGSQTYTWSSLRPGTFIIQSATHQALQVQMGLYAVLVVHPATAGQAYVPTATVPAAEVTYTTEHVLVFSEVDKALHDAVSADDYGPGKLYTSTMNYHPSYYLINGQPVALGAQQIPIGSNTDDILLRLVNTGYQTKIPTFQGQDIRLLGQDGFLAPYTHMQYSVELTPGKTKDVILSKPNTPVVKFYDSRMSISATGAAGGGLLADLLVSFANMTIISPNGGESLLGGADTTIQWTAKTGAASYLLRYSLDNGVNWSWIQNGVTGTSYTWTVPNQPSSQALVRVNAKDSAGNFFANDFSDAPFTIVGAPQVLSPNGGETLNGGSIVTISWQAHPGAASYLLRYSTDNGGTWQWLRNNVTGTSFDWRVPNVDSGLALIRVNAKNTAGNFIGNDFSDATFTIVQTPRVLVPNGGETVFGGTQETVQWEAVAAASSYDVSLSTDGGATWSSIVTGVTGTSSSVTVPNNGTAAALVKVEARDAGGTLLSSDQSDGPFTIRQVARILAPNGGETLTAGTTTTITWEALPNASSYLLRYSTDGGSTWQWLRNGVTGTSFTWTVPAAATVQGLVRVNARDFAGSFISNDWSDNPFTIVVP